MNENKTIISTYINVDNIEIEELQRLTKQLSNDLKKEELEILIQGIINLIRKEYQEIINKDLNAEMFTNKCDLFQAITYYIFRKLEFKVTPLQTQRIISNDVTGHSLIMIEYHNFKYLIDLTYKQFFEMNGCKKENYIINYDKGLILLAPLPGYYYLNNPQNVIIAKELIEKGYMEASEENLKIYFDSFYLTKRGKLIGGGLLTKSNISGSVYLNACMNCQDEIHYTEEDLNNLGFSLYLPNEYFKEEIIRKGK